MGKSLPLSVALGLLAILTVAEPAAAQRNKITLTPFVGGLVPLSERGRVTVNILGQDQSAVFEMRSAPAFGARLAYQTRGRFGIEGSYFIASSKSRISLILAGTSVGRDQDGQIQGGGIKATYRLTNGRTDTDFQVSAGVSGTKHSGDLFDATRAQDQFDVGGVLGAGLHLLLSPMVTFRVDGELNLYKWSQFRALQSKSQTDVLMTVGLALRLGR